MLVRAGVVAVVLALFGWGIHWLNPTEMYNEMYPPDGLKRDAFGLCHDTDETFVRAVRADRIDCYDRMPHPIALAIGWARHGSGLAAPPPPSLGILETADLFLAGLTPGDPADRGMRIPSGLPALPSPCGEELPGARARSAALAAAMTGHLGNEAGAGDRIALLPAAPVADGKDKKPFPTGLSGHAAVLLNPNTAPPAGQEPAGATKAPPVLKLSDHAGATAAGNGPPAAADAADSGCTPRV